MKEKKLFRKDFTLVVIGQIISLFGNAILRFALPLYLLRVTGSASLFGIVTACSFLPMIVLSLLGGVLADRVNKRNIMVGLDFFTAVIIAVLTVVLGKLPIVPLFAVTLMLLYGISGTYQPTVQASIPALTEKEKLLSANAVINQISALAGLLGPVIGGMLYGSFGLFPILLISIVCFMASAIMEVFITIPFEKRKAEKKVLSIVGDDLRESMEFVKLEKPVFIKLVLVVAVFNLVLSAMIIVGIPVLIIDTLALTDGMLGITQGALAFGGLVGGMLIGVIGNKLSLRNGYKNLLGCSGAVFLMSITLAVMPGRMVCYAVITAMSFLAMICSTMFTVQMLSTVQEQTPSELVGKVIACILAIAMCAQPLGQAIYGFLFEQGKNLEWIILFGAALVSSVVAIYSKRVFSELEENQDDKGLLQNQDIQTQ